MRQRILCFAPYSNYHNLHGMWECTVLHGLALRGAQVRYVLCDGLGEVCDLFRLNKEQKSCAHCQARSAGFADTMAMEGFAWLGRFISPQEFKLAEQWAQSIDAPAFEEARYGDWNVGAWIKSSMHTYFREESLDTSRSDVCEAVRGFLQTTLLVAFGVSRLLEDFRPDALFLFNGRMSMCKAALKLALAAGIPVFTHERGNMKNALAVGRDDIPKGRSRYAALWNLWADAPLWHSECQAVQDFLDNRALGKIDTWRAYSPATAGASGLRQALGLPVGDKVVPVFTSSNDEMADREDYKHGAFTGQREWLELTLRLLGKMPGVSPVVRVHPNLGGKRAFGISHGGMGFIEQMRKNHPQTRFILPDEELSSYDLIDIAHAGLVFASTVGLEMAARALPVVCGASTYYTMCPAVDVPKSPGEYAVALRKLVGLPHGMREPECRRMAFRFINGSFLNADTPFPLVVMDTPYSGRIAYKTTEQLVPGKDAGLDRVCRIILEDEEIYARPSQRPVDQEEEDAFFQKLDAASCTKTE